MIEIKHRYTDDVLLTVDAETLTNANLQGADLRYANLHGADLTNANLQDANLHGANLRYANLQGADLQGANLRYANLHGADLQGANLQDANLQGANLQGADLTGAILRYAILTGAILTRANLQGANLHGANLTRANLQGANLTRANLPIVPSIDHIDAAILAAIAAPGHTLDMRNWHARGPCGTAHCRAGWAIHLCGAEGYKLEALLGPSAAGALIYAASGSHPVPDFVASNKDALADMRERAGKA